MTEPIEDADVYAALGEEGFTSLVGAFYPRVRQDDVVGKMYPPDDWEGAEKRLRDFLIFRFGGPTRYIEDRGHPRLRMRHIPFAIDIQARDRWFAMMSEALDEQGLSPAVDAHLRGFFAHVADFLRNRPG